jgi:hypothetical protein
MILLARKFVDFDTPPRTVGLAGEYKLVVRSGNGVILRETPWFPNIITNVGLNRWGTGKIIDGAAIGTGTATPAATDTSLQALSIFTTTPGPGNTNQTVQGSVPYYTAHTAVFRTPLGALNGNFSEVGVGWNSVSLFSRALILDAGGNPTTITVLVTEQLDIVYRLRIYPPSADTSTSITIAGITYTVTGRASNVTSLSIGNGWGAYVDFPVSLGNIFNSQNVIQAVTNGAIGAITGGPSGTPAQVSTSGTDSNAYSNNSLTRTGTIFCDLNDGNTGSGIRSFGVGWSIGRFQYDFGSLIPKDNTKTLTMNFSISWARRP